MLLYIILIGACLGDGFFNPSYNNRFVNRNLIEVNERNNEIDIVHGIDTKFLDFLKKKTKKRRSLVDNKKNIEYYNMTIFKNKNKKVKNKKVISISPGGLKGFYLMGVMNYIKEHYDTKDIIFTGASAGAWSSLFSAYKHNSTYLANKILHLDFDKLNSIYEIQLLFKTKFLYLFNDEDFELDKIFIGVTVLNGLDVKTIVYYNFKSLEDAVNCCIASSHIPFLTNNFFIYKYNNAISFDGGFSNYPYLDLNNTILNVNPLIWDETNKSRSSISYEALNDEISVEAFKKEFNKGYNDTKNNKEYLDLIFM